MLKQPSSLRRGGIQSKMMTDAHQLDNTNWKKSKKAEKMETWSKVKVNNFEILETFTLFLLQHCIHGIFTI